MLKLLLAERLKLWKDRHCLLSFAGLLGTPLLVAVIFVIERGEFVKRGAWTGVMFFEQSLNMQALLLGPMMMAICGAYLITIEYRANTLKSLLPLPVSFSGLYAAKIVLGFVTLALALAAAALCTVAAPWALGAPAGITGGYGRLLVNALRHETLQFVMLWASLSFAMLVALVGRSFVPPLAASLIAHIAGLLAGQGGKGHLLWASIPFLAMRKLNAGQTFGTLVATSLAYAVGFAALGLVWTRFARRPE